METDNYGFTKNQEEFPAIYRRLSQEQRDVLKLLSVIYEKISRSNLCARLKQSSIRCRNLTPYDISTIDPVLNDLEGYNLVQFLKKSVRCNLEFVELITSEAIKDNSFENFARVIKKTKTRSKSLWNQYSGYTSYEQGIRDIRIELYRRSNFKTIQDLLVEVLRQFPREYSRHRPFLIILTNPFNKELLSSLDPQLLTNVLNSIIADSVLRQKPVDYIYLFLQEHYNNTPNVSNQVSNHLLLQYILRGEQEKARTLLIDKKKKHYHFEQQGMLSFIYGETKEAITSFRAGLDHLKPNKRSKNICYTSVEGLFYPMALIQSGDTVEITEAVRYLQAASKKHEITFIQPINDILQTAYLALGQKKMAQTITHSSTLRGYTNYISIFVSYLTLYWQAKAHPEKDYSFLIKLLDLAEEAGYFWLAREAAALLDHFEVKTRASTQRLNWLTAKCLPCPTLITNINHFEEWERILSSLINIQATTTAPCKSQKSRLVWLLDNYGHNRYSIVPKLQKLNKSGRWTKGRAVAFKTLANNPESLDCLSPQDKQVIAAISNTHRENGYYYYNEHYTINHFKAFKALVGHPCLFFHNNLSINIELVLSQPEMHVEKTKDGFKISMKPAIEDGRQYTIFEETPTRLKLVILSDEYQQISHVLDSPIEIPQKAKAMVLDAVAAIAPMLTVHSDIGGTSENVKEVAADEQLFLHLMPAGAGLRVEFYQKPLTESGSFYPPGSSGKVVMAEINNQQLQCTRDLESEKVKADKVIALCPVLQGVQSMNYAYLLEDPEDCLELLSGLHSLGDMVDIQWPQGESIKVSTALSASQFSLRIKRENDWFSASGSLQIDDKTVIDMKKLLELSRLSESRFIKLDDGQFLALTTEFKRRLEEIRSFSETSKKGVNLNPLAALALEDFTAEVGSFKADRHWKNNIKRFEPVDHELPSTLQAELRDYQLEGFKWLASLSQWQVGACLADDMGLGKTVQSLAAILLRAPKGPTLVIAPTSVMMNWQDEAARFAPTLNVICFGGPERQQILDDLVPFDLLICSYGLLQIEGEKLAKLNWQTIILDEAQAIKNMATKRSKAAMSLQAQFRIITTGTPIENHLGELWNLFNFINPGLLGSIESFNQKFALPIEKLKDKKAGIRLKKLIRPFILRRLKRDVLQELPARTDITMQVEMSATEAAMYEAQRSMALEKLEEADNQQHGGKQMQILAEITRLRRFCCNPNLVLPRAKIASSKLKVFGQIATELLQNKHKALVFSQFVGHLKLIKAYLQENNISFQYLDGSTTVKQRQKRVNDFQAGKGDIFLISLKAGGSGLNLTAADYVIHMDPWWNPAVEDQASDRAHRIGQKRPVTVYRLVVKDTIEEKIVAMHKHKRDLADNLLDGSDMSGRISTAELLSLLKES